jgi:CPA2 family monovalent cation:H+ antiporter-2
MLTHLDLILTLTGGLTAALVLCFITHRVGLSPIVANEKLASKMAEVGVILLMVGVGLHFHRE